MVYSLGQPLARNVYFEVDSTESVWYNKPRVNTLLSLILKLTPQSQYGIPYVVCKD